ANGYEARSSTALIRDQQVLGPYAASAQLRCLWLRRFRESWHRLRYSREGTCGVGVGFFRQLLKHDTKGEFLFARLRQLNGKLAGDTRFNEDAGRRDECRRGGDEHILAEGVLVPFFYVRFQMDDAITGVNYRQRCKGASTRLDRHRQDVANDLRPEVGAALYVCTRRGPWTCRAWVRVPNAGRFHITTAGSRPHVTDGQD